SEWGHRDGYMHVFLIDVAREHHDFVPPWLAYLYYGVSLVLIVSIALVVFRPIAERDSSRP
ncbi:MAG TPA: hypothetical protein VE986_04220, partial [Hyphomicrobiales bacterium]|nr:hypothetical protein [Hyphomicrobiales bacterium]